MFRALTAGAIMFSAATAFAGGNGAPTPATLDDLKTQCAEFSANPQMKPVQVKITCSEQSFFWQAGPAQGATLPNVRNIGATLAMKGYQVPEAQYPIAVSATPIQCETFVKMERVVGNVDTEVACADLAAITDLGAYCAPILDQAVAQNPGLAQVTPTKETTSLCPAK